MISKKTKYALKALRYLAEHSNGDPVLISELAEEERIPRKFLEAILVSLRKGGILRSKIGKGGGYMLAMPPASITIGSIVDILEGSIALVECLNGNARAGCEDCEDQSCCGIRLVMGDVKRAMDLVLESTTLADMIEISETARRYKFKIMDFSI